MLDLLVYPSRRYFTGIIDDIMLKLPYANITGIIDDIMKLPVANKIFAVFIVFLLSLQHEETMAVNMDDVRQTCAQHCTCQMTAIYCVTPNTITALPIISYDKSRIRNITKM